MGRGEGREKKNKSRKKKGFVTFNRVCYVLPSSLRYATLGDDNAALWGVPPPFSPLSSNPPHRIAEHSRPALLPGEPTTPLCFHHGKASGRIFL